MSEGAHRLALRLLVVGALLFVRCVRYDAGIEVELAFRGAPATHAVDLEDGRRVQVEEARLNVEGVELVRCSHASLFGASVARAHALETSGETRSMDFVHASGLPMTAGTLRPMPGHYCGARVHLSEDAIAISGRDEEGELALGHEGACDLEVAFAAPVVLDEARAVVLEIHVDQRRWLEGLDFEAAAPEALLANVTAASSATVRE